MSIRTACYESSTMSPTAEAIGTTHFLSPEMKNKQKIDHFSTSNRPKVTTRYPVSRSSSFIGPIPSPILHEESRLKTRKIPFATPLLTASLFSSRNVIKDSDLILPSSLSGDDPAADFVSISSSTASWWKAQSSCSCFFFQFNCLTLAKKKITKENKKSQFLIMFFFFFFGDYVVYRKKVCRKWI